MSLRIAKDFHCFNITQTDIIQTLYIGSHVKGDAQIIIHFDLSMPYLNLHLSLYIVHISIRHCKSLAFVENIVIASAHAIEL